MGREGVVKQMLATQCASSLKEIPTHTADDSYRTVLSASV